MSMRVINWEEYVKIGTRDWGLGTGDCCPKNDNAPDFNTPNCSLLTAHCSFSLAVTIGVFDGVHLGHQSLIHRICEPPAPDSLLPTVVTFSENPMKSLNPAMFTGDIYSLDQKLRHLESLGVKLTVLIDFFEEICKINGRDFIDLLLGSQPVTLLALGKNFRCGHGQDTGVAEIQSLAKARGVETWVAPVVMTGDSL